jgi:Carboxypeptidase regulatory-like domain
MARTFCLLTLIACFACAGSAYAQSPGGNISGVITDEQGAPVSGVFVTAHGTDQSQRIETAADGQYLLHDLVAGRYVLTAARDGYASVVRNGIMVRVGKTASLPLVIKIDPVKEARAAASRVRNPEAGRTVVANGSLAMLPAYNPVALLPPSPAVLIDQRAAQIRR